MAQVSDPELSAYVELHDCCIQDKERTVLTKANELLRSSKSTPHVHNVSPADDSQKIGKDAFAVLQAFEDISAEIGMTNDAAVKKEWDNNYKASIQSGFNDKVIAKLSKNGKNWQEDKKLIADFIKNDKDGENFISQIGKASQKFTDLKRDTQAFHKTYADNATKKGQAYNAKLKEMNDNRRNIQSQIDSNRASSAQLRNSMRRTAGPGFFFGWLVRTVLSMLGVNAFNQANTRVTELEREEQELVKKRAAIDTQANGLAKQESALAQTRHAVSVVADNVSDISGRLNTLAETWSGIRSSFIKLGMMLEFASDSMSQDTFMMRIELIKESTSSLKDNFQSYINGVAPGGVIPQPIKKSPAYDISRMYGNSDGGGGVQAFNDAQPDLDPTMSISEINIVSGWVVDGFHVTYRLKNGGTRKVMHGTNRSGAQVFLKRTEYISAIWGRSGRADNGEPWYGDCVQQLTFEITDSATGAKRNTGTYGQAFKLSPAATTNISWRGRLLCVSGTANNGAAQVGLRGIKFVQLKP
ncbi:hypothetical protein BN14_10050 [Rhizoctonia solani AG-1 IB]|uniref:Uncharacterized protein n=1 Tax=Thanatephorus cucumeris (strain AG1-IB / isolate 7/3/14) TaxID=1108050 RepID=M5C998_THACB|nr:hypothetical protein BN14_10050 [Rhizoctonia solani AG-1 IB]